MISIDPTKNSERDNYKLLIGSIIPRPIAFVTTQSEEGIVNGAPFSYFNIVSSNPPMVSLAIQSPNDQLKDTARNIYSNNQFVVHIVDDENGSGSDLFIGEVVRFHIDEEIYKNGRIDARGLNAVSRLAGSSYAAIGDIFSIDRPK